MEKRSESRHGTFQNKCEHHETDMQLQDLCKITRRLQTNTADEIKPR